MFWGLNLHVMYLFAVSREPPAAPAAGQTPFLLPGHTSAPRSHLHSRSHNTSPFFCSFCCSAGEKEDDLCNNFCCLFCLWPCISHRIAFQCNKSCHFQQENSPCQLPGAPATPCATTFLFLLLCPDLRGGRHAPRRSGKPPESADD